MTNHKMIEAAIAEVEQKNFGVTEQFLEVHEIEYTDGKPVVEGIRPAWEEGGNVVYFKVKEESFFFAVYLSAEGKVEWVDTEDYYSITLTAGSDTLPLADIVSHTSLKHTHGWSIEDARGSTTHKDSLVRFEASIGPGEFSDKMDEFLDMIETDREGVLRLAAEFGGYIQVAAIFHNGNTALGGVDLTVEQMKRMTALNLSIDFDLYAEGEFFKDDNEKWD